MTDGESVLVGCNLCGHLFCGRGTVGLWLRGHVQCYGEPSTRMLTFTVCVCVFVCVCVCVCVCVFA